VNKGESFYNPLIKPMLEDLESRQLITVSDGARCVFVPKRKVPLMVQKSDGGYGYDTTDITAMRYRVTEQNATWIVYVTDEGQKLHFDTVYDAAKLAGYIDPAQTRYDHVGFGLVLQVMPGEEVKEEAVAAGGKPAAGGKKEAAKKPAEVVEGGVPVEEEKKGEEKKADDAKKPKIGKMKTREGDSTKLMDLLDEAKNRTLEIFKERMKEDEEGDGVASKVQVDMTELEKTAEIMGISSVKYYDLKQNRVQNYVFAFDKMLDPRGNTGIYLLYMYVRVLSIMRKGSYESEILQSLIANPDAKFSISNKSERELAIALLRVPEQIDLAMTDLQLNRMTDQLYEIAVKIGEFYQQSKVLGSEEEKSRILLLEATRKIMFVLFNLLGMKTIERI
jgi:arginyl-tRNA synthetase